MHARERRRSTAPTIGPPSRRAHRSAGPLLIFFNLAHVFFDQPRASPRGSGYPPATGLAAPALWRRLAVRPRLWLSSPAPGCAAARVGPRPLACGLACGRARPRRGARLSWSFRCPRPCARGGVAKSSPCPRTGELPLHGGPSSPLCAISFSLRRLVPAC
jgi:hypothetical protein